MRQKSKMRNWMAKALCAVMLTVQMFPNGLVVRAASQENQSATQEVVTTTPEVTEKPVIHKKTVAIYYVLNRGQVLPLYNDTLDYYHWSKLPSYGFTDKQTNIENNVKAVEDSIISVPEGGDALLKEGEEIR